ncbi:hypothetical protein Ciccas_012718 [Cichlidogyrus casuarinus]|uniref:Uncharacterized protein n=1 Tax=Cichlidogyrus casuarinus TaxID=1844966 RepID=A0ABD2PML3_9PLAT
MRQQPGQASAEASYDDTTELEESDNGELSKTFRILVQRSDNIAQFFCLATIAKSATSLEDPNTTPEVVSSNKIKFTVHCEFQARFPAPLHGLKCDHALGPVNSLF